MMTDEQIDTTALREHAGKGWGDDCLLPKASVNRMADELDSLRALLASKPAVPKVEHEALIAAKEWLTESNSPRDLRDKIDAALAAPAQSYGDAEQADEAVTDAMVRRTIIEEAANIAESMLLYTGYDVAQRLRDVAKDPFYLCDCISHEECKSLSGCQLKGKS